MNRATLFRQSMFAEFEKIVHDKIEKQESLASEDLNNIYYQLNEKYFGSNMIIDKQIQYEWARIPHFYTDFYVYKYATGISAAISIASNILSKGESFVEKYINMSTSLVGKDLKSFHVKMWLFTHGIATLIASGAVNLTDEEISNLLSSEFKALMLLGAE